MSRNITKDLIVKIKHPEWTERRARLLISDDGTAAVFTVKGAPKHVLPYKGFDARTGRLTLDDEDSTVVKFQRVGASCTWPLAKCQIASLASYWPEEDRLTDPAASDAILATAQAEGADTSRVSGPPMWMGDSSEKA